MRDGGEGAGADGEGGGGGRGHSPCGCSRSEHKHKHRKHRHRMAPEHPGGASGGGEDEDEEQEEGEAEARSEFSRVEGRGRRGGGGREVGGGLMTESPWQRRNGKDSGILGAASSMPAGERLKYTPLTCLGLGSAHLSSFGGSWLKRGGLGGTGFGHASSSPSPWGVFTGGTTARRTGFAAGGLTSSREEPETSHLYGRPLPSMHGHTNLFTSAAMATEGGRGPRSGSTVGENPVGGGSQRREGSSWTERRGPDSFANIWSGSFLSNPVREQKKQSAPPGGSEGKRRGPGRPRKYPLPSPPPSPETSPHQAPSCTSSEPPDVPAGRGKEGVEREGGRGREGVERGGEEGREGVERGGRGREGESDGVEEAIELGAQARRKRGRKRKRAESPLLLSPGQGKVKSNAYSLLIGQINTSSLLIGQNDTSSLLIGQSQLSPALGLPPTPVIQWEDGPPRKRFQKAGLYSDDYKTTDPPSQSKKQLSGESVEDSPGERGYSLLPAPLHVGKYLRLKRIDFQLPYDILWLWRHRQLQREPDAPLYRKRTLCRPKDSVIVPPHHHLPTEECSAGIRTLFPHLDMEPLTNSERCFVLKQRVFLVRNWQLVRDRQMQLRTDGGRERGRDRERDGHLYCDGGGEEGNGNHIFIKSGQPTGVRESAITSELRSHTQGTPTTRSARSHLSTREEEEEEEGMREEEEYRREIQRERLDMILLRLQRA